MEKKMFSPIWANLGLGPKKLALFRGHLLFILGTFSFIQGALTNHR